MGTISLLAAAGLMLLAGPSFAKDANRAIKPDRTVRTASRPAISKNLREAKRTSRVAVISTDVRQKRYLASTEELDEQPGGVLLRRSIGGDAISDGP